MDVLELKSILTELINASAEDQPAKISRLYHDNPKFSHAISAGLADTSNESTLCDTVQIIAELGKSEECRKSLEPCLNALAAFLRDESLSAETFHQVFRAVGNICYENDSGRGILRDVGGIPNLVGAVGKWLNVWKESVFSVDQTRMLTVSIGCLCNVIEGNVPCQTAAVTAGLIKLLSDVLAEQPHLPPSLYTLLLAALSSLTGHADFRPAILNSQLVTITLYSLQFADGLPTESTEYALDFLTDLSVTDGGLPVLATSGVVGALISVITAATVSTEEESRDLSKKAENLLVEILAHSDSLSVVTIEETNHILSAAAEWLVEECETTLSTTAALVIGNLARDKSSCDRIFEITGNIPVKLLGLLKRLAVFDQYEVTEGEAEPVNRQAQLQYALLSALKNLSVDEELRLRLVALGGVEVMVEISIGLLPQPESEIEKALIPVVAKLLTTLRMYARLNESVARLVGSRLELLQLVLRSCEVRALLAEAIGLLLVLSGYSALRPSLRGDLRKIGLMQFIIGALRRSVPEQVGALVLANALLGKKEDCSQPEEILDPFRHTDNETEDVDGGTDCDHPEDLNQSLLTALTTCLLEEKVDPAVMLNGLLLLETIAQGKNGSSLAVTLTGEIVVLIRQLQSHADERIRAAAKVLDKFL
ncbi:hypothetical protein BV898_04738 [Hypsibius exemplaris]|uniref:Rap1 GTPase-GDP dissociation stimulator 1-B n=1 Tax=Hypsibius exemplaris TaxID=2072580 RepID=A0A1W0X1D7_HYPEX|nr:hypothetical protein BV898_04738 [Hypsibius exemplaris]